MSIWLLAHRIKGSDCPFTSTKTADSRQDHLLNTGPEALPGPYEPFPIPPFPANKDGIGFPSFYSAIRSKILRLVSSSIRTAPFSCFLKPFLFTSLRLISDSTNRSASTGLNSSIKSKAKDTLRGAVLGSLHKGQDQPFQCRCHGICKQRINKGQKCVDIV